MKTNPNSVDSFCGDRERERLFFVSDSQYVPVMPTNGGSVPKAGPDSDPDRLISKLKNAIIVENNELIYNTLSTASSLLEACEESPTKLCQQFLDAGSSSCILELLIMFPTGQVCQAASRFLFNITLGGSSIVKQIASDTLCNKICEIATDPLQCYSNPISTIEFIDPDDIGVKPKPPLDATQIRLIRTFLVCALSQMFLAVPPPPETIDDMLTLCDTWIPNFQSASSVQAVVSLCEAFLFASTSDIANDTTFSILPRIFQLFVNCIENDPIVSSTATTALSNLLRLFPVALERLEEYGVLKAVAGLFGSEIAEMQLASMKFIWAVLISGTDNSRSYFWDSISLDTIMAFSESKSLMIRTRWSELIHDLTVTFPEMAYKFENAGFFRRVLKIAAEDDFKAKRSAAEAFCSFSHSLPAEVIDKMVEDEILIPSLSPFLSTFADQPLYNLISLLDFIVQRSQISEVFREQVANQIISNDIVQTVRDSIDSLEEPNNQAAADLLQSLSTIIGLSSA